MSEGQSRADELLAVDDIRMFVPSQDFAQSKSFYSALGWTTVWTDDDGLAILELADHRFMLQDHYVREWGGELHVHRGGP